MLATLSIIGTLLTSLPLEKVNFAHIFEPEKTISYTLNVTGNQGGQEMKIASSVDLLIGSKTEKGTNVTLSPKTLTINAGGNEMDQTSSLSDSKILLDANGIPDNLELNGTNTFVSVMLILTYLPNKELEVGDTYEFSFKRGSVAVKGSGKFEGTEKLNDVEMQKLKVTSTVTPESGGDGELTYTVLFDKSKGRVVEVTGRANVEGEELDISLKQNPKKQG